MITANNNKYLGPIELKRLIAFQNNESKLIIRAEEEFGPASQMLSNMHERSIALYYVRVLRNRISILVNSSIQYLKHHINDISSADIITCSEDFTWKVVSFTKDMTERIKRELRKDVMWEFNFIQLYCQTYHFDDITKPLRTSLTDAWKTLHHRDLIMESMQ